MAKSNKPKKSQGRPGRNPGDAASAETRHHLEKLSLLASLNGRIEAIEPRVKAVFDDAPNPDLAQRLNDLLDEAHSYVDNDELEAATASLDEIDRLLVEAGYG